MENKLNLDVKECIRFLVCGFFLVGVDFAVYRLLFPHMSILLAKAIAYIVGTITGFFINKFWTFRSRKGFLREAVLYALLYTVTAFVNTFVNKFVFATFDSLIFAYLSATAVSTLLNFAGQKYIIFRKKENQKDEV